MTYVKIHFQKISITTRSPSRGHLRISVNDNDQLITEPITVKTCHLSFEIRWKLECARRKDFERDIVVIELFDLKQKNVGRVEVHVSDFFLWRKEVEFTYLFVDKKQNEIGTLMIEAEFQGVDVIYDWLIDPDQFQNALNYILSLRNSKSIVGYISENIFDLIAQETINRITQSVVSPRKGSNKSKKKPTFSNDALTIMDFWMDLSKENYHILSKLSQVGIYQYIIDFISLKNPLQTETTIFFLNVLKNFFTSKQRQAELIEFGMHRKLLRITRKTKDFYLVNKVLETILYFDAENQEYLIEENLIGIIIPFLTEQETLSKAAEIIKFFEPVYHKLILDQNLLSYLNDSIQSDIHDHSTTRTTKILSLIQYFHEYHEQIIANDIIKSLIIVLEYAKDFALINKILETIEKYREEYEYLLIDQGYLDVLILLTKCQFTEVKKNCLTKFNRYFKMDKGNIILEEKRIYDVFIQLLSDSTIDLFVLEVILQLEGESLSGLVNAGFIDYAYDYLSSRDETFIRKDSLLYELLKSLSEIDNFSDEFYLWLISKMISTNILTLNKRIWYIAINISGGERRPEFVRILLSQFNTIVSTLKNDVDQDTLELKKLKSCSDYMIELFQYLESLSGIQEIFLYNSRENCQELFAAILNNNFSNKIRRALESFCITLDLFSVFVENDFINLVFQDALTREKRIMQYLLKLFQKVDSFQNIVVEFGYLEPLTVLATRGYSQALNVLLQINPSELSIEVFEILLDQILLDGDTGDRLNLFLRIIEGNSKIESFISTPENIRKIAKMIKIGKASSKLLPIFTQFFLNSPEKVIENDYISVVLDLLNENMDLLILEMINILFDTYRIQMLERNFIEKLLNCLVVGSIPAVENILVDVIEKLTVQELLELNTSIQSIRDEVKVLLEKLMDKDLLFWRSIFTAQGTAQNSDFFENVKESDSTLLLIQKEGIEMVVGAYTSKKWDETNNFQSDTDAKIFLLDPSENFVSTYRIKKEEKFLRTGTFSGHGLGPTFGLGDLVIDFDKWHIYHNIGVSYDKPSRREYEYISMILDNFSKVEVYAYKLETDNDKSESIVLFPRINLLLKSLAEVNPVCRARIHQLIMKLLDIEPQTEDEIGIAREQAPSKILDIVQECRDFKGYSFLYFMHLSQFTISEHLRSVFVYQNEGEGSSYVRYILIPPQEQLIPSVEVVPNDTDKIPLDEVLWKWSLHDSKEKSKFPRNQSNNIETSYRSNNSKPVYLELLSIRSLVDFGDMTYTSKGVTYSLHREFSNPRYSSLQLKDVHHILKFYNSNSPDSYDAIAEPFLEVKWKYFESIEKVLPTNIEAEYIHLEITTNVDDEKSTISFDVNSITFFGYIPQYNFGAPPPDNFDFPKFSLSDNLAEFRPATVIKKTDVMNGVLHYIGTMDQPNYIHPLTTQKIGLELSHLLYSPTTMHGQSPETNVIGPNNPQVDTYWGGSVPQYFILDLISYVCCPSGFTIKHGHIADSFIRNWRLDASNDNINWDVIYSHETGRTCFSKDFEIMTFELSEPTSIHYQFFKLIHTGNYSMGINDHSAGAPYMCVNGFELYGTITENEDITIPTPVEPKRLDTETNSSSDW